MKIKDRRWSLPVEQLVELATLELDLPHVMAAPQHDIHVGPVVTVVTAVYPEVRKQFSVLGLDPELRIAKNDVEVVVDRRFLVVL
jgi:hypothetical protein